MCNIMIYIFIGEAFKNTSQKSTFRFFTAKVSFGLTVRRDL